jgi:diguanylate cyclase (GGDEF)-like protein/PAS domain S-box-containing protein
MSFYLENARRILLAIGLFLLAQLALHIYIENQVDHIKSTQQHSYQLYIRLHQSLDKFRKSKQNAFHFNAYYHFLNKASPSTSLLTKLSEAKLNFQKLGNFELSNINTTEPETSKSLHPNVNTLFVNDQHRLLFQNTIQSIDLLHASADQHFGENVKKLSNIANVLLVLLMLTMLALILMLWRINFSLHKVIGAPLKEIRQTIDKLGNKEDKTYAQSLNNGTKSIYSQLKIVEENLANHEVEKNKLSASAHEMTTLLNRAEQLAHLGSWELDLVNKKLIWSNEVFQIFEVDQQHFTPDYQSFINFTHPLDRDAVKDAFTTSISTKSPYDITHRLLMPDGRVKWVRECGVSDYDTDSKAIRSSGTVQDITELKNIEDQLHIAAVAFELKEGIVITDAEGTILRVNKAFSEITGYSSELAIGQKMNFLKSELHDDDFYHEMWKVVARDGEWHGEIWNRVHGGAVRLHSVVISTVKDSQEKISYYIGTYIDITEKQYAEDQLRIAAITFETHEAIMITDADSKIVRVNRAFEKLTGYQSSEVIGNNPRILNSGRHDPSFYSEMWESLVDQGAWTGEVWDKRKDGSIYPKQLTVTAVKNAKGVTANYVGIFMDISERKVTEETLRQSERYLTNILNSLDEVVWTAVAPDYQWRHVNAATLKIYGVSPEEFRADPDLWIKFVHPDDLSEAKNLVERTLVDGKASAEYRILLANNEERWISDTRSMIQGQNAEFTELLGVFHDMTERKLIEKAGIDQHNRLISMLQTSPIAVRIAASSGRKVLFANNRYAKMINCNIDEVIGKDPIAYYADQKDYECILEDLNNGLQVNDKLIKLLIPNAGPIWVMASYLEVDYAGEPAVLGWFYDVTALRDAQEAQQKSEQQLKRSLEELKYQKHALDKHAIVAITDIQGRITYANQKFCEISGYSLDELIGKDHAILNSGYHPKGFWKAMYRSVSRGNAWHDEVCNRAKDGHLYWVDTTIAPFIGDNGKPESYISIRTDITQGKLAEEKSTYLALYDSLTGLPNRRLLQDRLKQALTASERSGKKGALLFLDLDHFKVLNDTLGHDVGDLLLQQVGERLVRVVREGDTVARLGGDEFVIVLESLDEQVITSGTQAKMIGKKILSELNKPYQLNTHKHLITPSIGITLFDGYQESIDDLLKQADIAMYQAKKTGRNAVSFFDPEMQTTIYARVGLEHELHEALEKNQFELHYQLQVDASKRPTGVEALLRWVHPERGMISPLQFIPLAEESDLILHIGKWVLNKACAQLKEWQNDKQTSHLTISINVSPKHLHQANFVSQIKSSVKKYAIDPTKLKLELTENILLNRMDEIIEKMNALKVLGIRFSLDDFGTGYSSLQYLKRLPLYQLKIDQSFVRDIATDTSDQEIIRTIIAMAHTLNLNVIAEGVETNEQQALLESNGCLHYQGYLFGKPVPIDELSIQLETISQVTEKST